MTRTKLTLCSHHLCPYVQRAVILLTEKKVPFRRVYIDLSNKPDWFLAVSPLGKTPVLIVGDTPIFESAVILEYLEETQPNRMHPDDPAERAEHRSWIEFCSSVLNEIWAFYVAPDEKAFHEKAKVLSDKFARLETRLIGEPYFDGKSFSIVDATFGPVFRYFDVFDRIGEFGIITGKPKVEAWRTVLATRPSIHSAVTSDYEKRLWQFLEARKSHLSTVMEGAG